jgi:hypothetical protein
MKGLHFRACARGISLCACTVVSLVAMGMTAATTAWAGPVSATPGTIQGVITFNAPFVPNSIEVDARDSANQYTATANAAQNDPGNCPAGSQSWCYSIIVESALANAYYLRPIAYVSESSPVFVATRVPFPPTALIPITAGATVPYNISYQPGEISGTVNGNDMSSQPLQVASLYFSFWDSANSLQEPCGGSVEFCPFNSVDQGSAPPLPAPATYQDFLKPNDSYKYGTLAIGFEEANGATTTIQFNGNQPLNSTPAAGQNVTQDYTLNQLAAISGNLTAPGQSIYNFWITTQGSTSTGNNFYELFNQRPQFIPPTPLTQPVTFTSRIFDLADFTKPVTIQPLLILSQDGTTLLQYPVQAVTGLTPGATVPVNYSATAASISGRVTFSPPYPAGNIYPGIQALTQDGGLSQASLVTDAMGGTYTLPAFGDTWQYWRFGWNFTLPNPNFKSSYFVGQFLTSPVLQVNNGQNVTGNNFTFPTALVKVLFTAPAGTTITDPQLAALTGNYAGGAFAPDFVETGNAEGLGFNSVLNAESDIVLRVHNVPFQITPSAIINPGGQPGTGRTTFSPIVINPKQGDIIIVGIPGTLSLTVTSPQNGQVFSTCQIPVTGSATGAQNITITVNGQPVQTTSANNSNDPNQVLFSTTVNGNGGNTQITVVGSAPGNTSVTDTLTVSANNPTVNVSAQVASSMLWPPNHDLVSVGLTATAQSACDGNPSLGVRVYSNESDVAETGTGNFSPDAAGIATGTLRLREERVATDPGRVYLILATGTSHGGGSGHACTTVVVPHDQSANSIAIVNSMANTAANTCRTTGQPPAGYVQVGIGPAIGPKQ